MDARADSTRETDALIQATVTAHVAPDAQIVAVRQRAGGAQGFSGAALHYYDCDVTYERADGDGQITLVTKNAPLHERRTLVWLGARGMPVPFSYTHDLTTDVPALICMQYIENAPAPAERALCAARALAAIHADTMGQEDALPWLPRADASYIAEIVAYWREPWQAALVGPEQMEAYVARHGYQWEAMALGGNFAAEFAADTPSLAAAAARFQREMAALWAEGDALTLIHADSHREHLRVRDSQGYILDWGQARYGPLYLDLPNYFARDDALLYRDALAERGHDIPRAPIRASSTSGSPFATGSVVIHHTSAVM